MPHLQAHVPHFVPLGKQPESPYFLQMHVRQPLTLDLRYIQIHFPAKRGGVSLMLHT